MSTATAIAIQPGHVGLNVTDLERSVAFYTRVFDLTAVSRSQDGERHYAFLSRDGQVLLTLWQQAAGTFDGGRSGLHHLALRVETVAEVQALQERLADMGIERRYGGIVLHAEGADSGGVYFADPDGIRLEVFTPSGVAATGAQAGSEHGPSCGHF